MPIILAEHQNGTAAAVVLLVAVAVSLGIGVAAGILPPRRASGSPRLPPDRPAWPLLVVLFWAAGMYVSSASVYRFWCDRRASAQAGHPLHIEPFPQTDEQAAVLSTIPPLVGLAALLLWDYSVREASRQELGMRLGRLLRGIARGALGIVIVFPFLLCLSQASEYIYRAIHYQHPAEHPLLKVLAHHPDPRVTALVYLGAWVAAPLWEELAFRGHLQTLLRRGLERFFSGAHSQPRPRSASTWAAIVCTSLLFTAVHPLWSQPVIFVLALCLGYAYERTANLWVPITIHALFNMISTMLFLGTR